MIAINPLNLNHHQSASAPLDFIQGATAGHAGGFTAALKPFMAQSIAPDRHQAANPVQLRPFNEMELSGPGGHRLAPPTTQPSHEALKPTDHIPGVRSKHPPMSAAISKLANDPAFEDVPAEKLGELEQQSRKWVAQTFFGTMLKQMHDSPFKSELFSGGRGGKAFEPLMDQHMADHMARGTGNKLVRSVMRQLAKKAYAKQSKSENPKSPANLNSARKADPGSPPVDAERIPGTGAGPNPIQNMRNHVTPSSRR